MSKEILPDDQLMRFTKLYKDSFFHKAELKVSTIDKRFQQFLTRLYENSVSDYSKTRSELAHYLGIRETEEDDEMKKIMKEAQIFKR